MSDEVEDTPLDTTIKVIDLPQQRETWLHTVVGEAKKLEPRKALEVTLTKAQRTRLYAVGRECGVIVATRRLDGEGDSVGGGKHAVFVKGSFPTATAATAAAPAAETAALADETSTEDENE